MPRFTSADSLRRVVPLAAPLLAVTLLVTAAFADLRKPLLIPGKKTLYERVLTRPGAKLLAEGSAAATLRGEVAPLSLFYVYGRKPETGTAEWVEVGPDVDGKVAGWIEASRTIAWRHMLGVNFTNPANRSRVLFFGEREQLESLVRSRDPATTAQSLQASLEKGGEDVSPVVALEPAEHVDIRRRFYLLPIVDAMTVTSESGFDIRLLEVASATADSEPTRPATGKLIRENLDTRDLRAGLVFVVDASKSMGPYIDRTRKAIEKIYEVIAESPWKKQFSFGLVGFRDSTKNRPGLEYVSRVFSPLTDAGDPASFLTRIQTLSPTIVSSENFFEDSFSGLKTAIEEIDWSPYQGRFVVLVTDAGSRSASDPQSGSKMDGDQIRSLAEKKGIAIYALHLLTPEGKADHARATKQYRAVTAKSTLGRPLYYPIESGSVDIFGRQVDSLARSIVDNVGKSASGEIISAPAGAVAAAADPARRQVMEDTGKVFREMQLAFLGTKAGTRAPDLIQAWAADRDLANPAIRALDVRVLLTKNQLSDLQQALEAILESGEATRISPKDFFDRIQEATLRAGRGTGIASKAGPSLADSGLLGDYLDGLPYRSKVMQLTADDWLSWSYAEQREFLDEVRSKLQVYREFHDDTDLWIDLGQRGSAGDWVYPVPLDDMP